MHLKDEFETWIKQNNRPKSGKANSYLTGLEDAQTIAQASAKFKIPSVYDMPNDCIISLRDYIDVEKRKEKNAAGSGAFNGLQGLHGLSYWRDGHCSAALGLLVAFRDIVEQRKRNATCDGADVLSAALKVFAVTRQICVWCADNTDGDKTKPRTGYAANAKLRVALPMTNNLGTDAQVVQWFKDYVYPDGKGWLDGIDTNGCAAFGGYINYLVTGGAAVARPAKFTRSLESAVKAIVKPASECFYNKDIHSVLKYLGLLGFEFKEDFDEDDYQDALHAQRVIKRRLKDMGEKQVVEWDAAANQAKPNDKDPDFLTVNEFLWFVKEHFKEIQNEVMNMNLETPTDETNPGNKEWKDILSDNPDDMMNRLVAALLTKPFAILAGASGTGKSRMVRKLAYMTCLNKQLQPDPAAKKPIENFRMVQVKPNWHDSTELLGYRSSVTGGHEYVSTDFVRFVLKAHAFPNTPFFVCLDEMNLAPVEHYFAEFLSASESARTEDGEYITDPIVDPGEFGGNIANLDPQGYSIPDARKALIEKRGLYLPKNLFVVGTVNMDDTTGGFSRKVLDRAMTIEMNEVNFDELQKPVDLRLGDKLDAAGAIVEKGLLLKDEQIKTFIDRVEFTPENFNNEFKNQLEDVRVKLATTPLAFAFRFARECVQYRDALRLLFPDKTDHTGYTLDHMFLMKILPRLVGNLDERQGVVDKLKTFFGTLANHSVSADKLKFMLDASEMNGGFLSYYM